MHFTREPIIETIISPREGYKLVLRSSKIATTDEYVADAVEVVSFGSSYFFRSLEKPKSFLLSVADYEVLEARETKVALKTTSTDRGIKIGGGKEAPKKEESQEEEELKHEKKRERKRSRRRRGRSEDKEEEVVGASATDPYDTFMEPGEHLEQEALLATPSAPIIPSSHSMHMLIPPPTNLISDSFGRHKEEPLADLPLPETPQAYKEKVEELIDDITED